jgi:hypothetical protein
MFDYTSEFRKQGVIQEGEEVEKPGSEPKQILAYLSIGRKMQAYKFVT